MDNKFLNRLSTFLLYISILIFIIAFNFAHNPPSGWYQQFLPNLNGASISDITFTDSLNGYAVTLSPANIVKTTNGGDNWTINYNYSGPLYKIQFINKNTGYVLSANKILVTHNQGSNWSVMNLPPDLYPRDIFVLNTDTIWAADSENTVGGLFRTTNGGQTWIRQYAVLGQNPDKVYFFNANLGFISVSSVKLFRTSDGGNNWTEILNARGFTDIKFIDTLTGWKALQETEKILKSTDGGLNWFDQYLPQKSNFIFVSKIQKLSLINKDTLWGSYPLGYSNGYKGLLYVSTNGGDTWGYQIPDTAYYSTIHRFLFNSFVNKNIGWAYYLKDNGVHTVTGGDTTFFVNIKQISSIVPSDFVLHQNYPNPFNPVTKIKFDVQKAGKVKLIVIDILGKEVARLVNEKLSAGSYEYSFNAEGLSSGVYFYSLVTEKITLTKKMLLTK